MHSNDIVLKRFQDAVTICGLLPHQCFKAAMSPFALEEIKLEILAAITGNPDIIHAIFKVNDDDAVPNRAFEIYPREDNKAFGLSHVRPISDWAF